VIAAHLKVLAGGFYPIGDGKKVIPHRIKAIGERIKVTGAA
jgi:hypothetical protein